LNYITILYTILLTRDHNDYKHLTVNHSVNFKDPITGAHTNQIDGIILINFLVSNKLSNFLLGLWNLAKKSLPETNRNKNMFAGYLASFMLHSKWKKEDGYSMFMNYAALCWLFIFLTVISLHWLVKLNILILYF
jgi:hypothetical protein